MSAKKQTNSRKKSGGSKSGSDRRRSVPESRSPLISPRIKSILFAGLALFFLILIFLKGETVWTVVRSFFFGVFGISVFLVPALFIYLVVMNEKEKHMVAHFKAKVFLFSLAILLVSALIYCITGARHLEMNFFAAIGNLYLDAYNSTLYIPLDCGLIGGLLGYPLALLGIPVAITLSLIVLAVIVFILTNLSVRDVAKAAERTVRRARTARKNHAQRRREREEERQRELEAERSSYRDGYEPEKRKNRKKSRKRSEIDVPIGNTSAGSDIDIPLDSKNRKEYISDSELDYTDPDEENARDIDLSDDLINIINRAGKPFGEDADSTAGSIADDITRNKSSRHVSGSAKQADPETVPTDTAPHIAEADEFGEFGYTPGGTGRKKEQPADKKTADNKNAGNYGGFEAPGDEKEKPRKQYHYPPVQLLKPNFNKDDRSAMEELQQNSKKLIETLNSFGVNASIVNICRGPSVTRYEIQPAPGVKISKITNLSDDIALNLAANGVRIEAPIPGKAAVGIEVPNKVVSMVTMRELIDSDKFRSAESKLTAVLGRDISGEIVVTDIAKMPHLLIAGTTGSGKSVCVNSILISILYKASPDDVKLLLIDPKMVEFSKYKGIPHLLVPIVSDAKKAAGALGWAVNEMLTRYKIFSEYDCKDIDSYNKLIDKNLAYMAENPPYEDEEGNEIEPVLEVNGLPVAKEKMCRIVIAIDELADLMMAAPSEVEDSICRLAQMARAAGMHLILATQRPTVNVITGLIKANVPSRISLKVSSNMDSRTILDAGGGEKLIGKGDMLFSPVGAPKPIRVQGCYASDEEIEGVTAYVKKTAKAEYNAEIEESIKRIAAEEVGNKKGKDSSAASDDDGLNVDDKMEEAIRCVIEAGQASTSLIQRRLKVGYARAGRMIDDMEQLGIVGPHQGSKPRDVLMTYNEWLERRNVLQNKED